MTHKASKIVALARKQTRMTSREWIEALCTDFFELKGDRCFGEDPAVIGGVARFNGRPITVIGTQKGTDLSSNLICHFGSPMPEGYRKAYRLMKQAEKFSRPILTFVNTPGANCSLEAETRGIGEAIAKNLLLMSQLQVPIITIFIGEGGSGGALALSVANKVYMLEYSMYAILSPEGFASILWKDSNRANEAAELMQLTPNDLLKNGIIDGVFKETQGITPIKKRLLIERIKAQIEEDLLHFDSLSKEAIKQHRQNRFRSF